MSAYHGPACGCDACTGRESCLPYWLDLDALTLDRHRRLANAIIACEDAWRAFGKAQSEVEQKATKAVCRARDAELGDVAATNEERARVMLALLDAIAARKGPDRPPGDPLYEPPPECRCAEVEAADEQRGEDE